MNVADENICTNTNSLIENEHTGIPFLQVDVKIERETDYDVESVMDQLYTDHVIKDDILMGIEVHDSDSDYCDYSISSENYYTPLPRLETQDINKNQNNTPMQTSEVNDAEEGTNQIIDLNKSTKDKSRETVKNQQSPKTLQHIECHEKTKQDMYLKCKVCSYQTITQTSLERHMKFHDKNRQFLCDICGNRYKKKTLLNLHLRNVHSDATQPKMRRILTRNAKSSHKKSIEQNNSEAGITSNNEKVRTNMKTKEKLQKKYQLRHKSPKKVLRSEKVSSKDLNCKDCGKNFVSKIRYTQHMDFHEKTKSNLYFKCKECSYQTVTQESLKKHMKFHDKKRHYECEICNYRYNSKSNLNEHLKIVHSAKKIHKCSNCVYRTNNIDILKKHLRIHRNEKPFVCSSCGYRCILKSDLIKHLRIHTGEKPYACSVCKYKFSTKSNLTKHIRIHTGEKPYSCSMCSYRSARKDNFTTHLKVHS